MANLFEAPPHFLWSTLNQTSCVCVCVWCHRCGPVVYLYSEVFAHWTVFPVLGYLGRGTSQWWWTGTKTEPWRAIWAWTPKILISGAVKEKIVISRNISLRKQQLQFLHTQVSTLHNIFPGSVSGCPSHVSVLECVLQWLQVWCNHREVRPGWSRDTPLNELLCKCSPLLRPLISSGRVWQLHFHPSILL